MLRRQPSSPLFPYTTLFRSLFAYAFLSNIALAVVPHEPAILWYGPRLGVWTTTLVGTAGTMLAAVERGGDRKSTRLNSSHPSISYAVFCLKKKNQIDK